MTRFRHKTGKEKTTMVVRFGDSPILGWKCLTFLQAMCVTSLFSTGSAQDLEECSPTLQTQCMACAFDTEPESVSYNCSLPGLGSFIPGQYEGVTANYLSFATETSSPSMLLRAKEFESCTGGRVIFSEANNVFEDPVKDLGTKSVRGTELYDAYFMSYSHFPEVSALGLAEPLNDRIRKDNAKLKVRLHLVYSLSK